MGETGCGKTRLVQFMCQLQCPDVKNVQNMFVMKVFETHTKKNFRKNKFSTPLHACVIHLKYRIFYTVGPWRNYKERYYSKSRRS